METLQAILKRKSTRNFDARQITEEALHTILCAGCAAPVGMARYDSLHLTIVQNKDLLRKISQTVARLWGRDGDPLYGAPTLIVISSTDSDASSSDTGYANASCIAENMLLAATDLSLDSVYLWGPPLALVSAAALAAAAGIPDGFKPLVSVAIGHAAQPNESVKESKITITMNRA